VDGHIFRKEHLRKWVNELIFLQKNDVFSIKTPNHFESKLQRFWTDSRQMIVCFESSTVVNSPNNKVQEEVDNRSGDIHALHQDDLLEMYNNGRRISFDKLYDSGAFENIICPHQEIDILKGLI